MDMIYQKICEKLGCEPKDLKFPKFEGEDDSWVNPFSVLTEEESEYLINNGYLPIK